MTTTEVYCPYTDCKYNRFNICTRDKILLKLDPTDTVCYDYEERVKEDEDR